MSQANINTENNVAASNPTPSHQGAFKGTGVIHGKSLNIELTARATEALNKLSAPVIADMELYFSCLIRKQVLFNERPENHKPSNDLAHILENLYVRFRPVSTAECRIADVQGKPPVKTMPIEKPERFVPDWLKIDFRRGQLLGEYGFSRHTY